jgi:hypothetical protein
MKATSAGRITLCLNFCQYYKPGKNEDLACRGYAVVGRLIESGKTVPLHRPRKMKVPGKAATQELKDLVCAACPFHEADCDFILTGGTAAPCGGVLLLLHLLGSGEITIEEIAGE